MVVSDSTATAGDVHEALRETQTTMLEVPISVAQELQEISSELHTMLAQDVGVVAFAVDQLLLNMEELSSESSKVKEQWQLTQGPSSAIHQSSQLHTAVRTQPSCH